MATITVNGVRLAYDEAGAGPPVVWVHGGFTDRRGADLIVPLLADRYRVITYDRRGHSQSERVPGHQGVMDHVTDLAALIERLDAAPAHLLANSDGGEIAFKLAVWHPELVASLCLNEPALYGTLLDDAEVKQAMEGMQARLDRMIAELEQGNDEAAARLVIETVAMGPGAWDALPQQSRRTFIHNGPTWLDHANDPTQGSLNPDDLTRISVPTLLTEGGHSDPVDRAVVAHLADAVPHARRHTIADAGHVPHRTHLGSPAWPPHTITRELRPYPAFDAEHAATITVPTLLLVGGDSPDSMKTETETLAAALPDASISSCAFATRIRSASTPMPAHTVAGSLPLQQGTHRAATMKGEVAHVSRLCVEANPVSEGVGLRSR